MADKKNPHGFVIAGGVLKGTFKVGMEIKGVAHKEFEMRDSSVEDLLDAELEVDVAKPMNFNTEVVARQLIRVGDYPGPFTAAMIRRLSKPDWRMLRAAQAELDVLGEDESADAPTS